MHELGGIHAEDLGQLEDVVQGGVPLPPPDLAQVAPVQTRLLSEPLLALPELVTRCLKVQFAYGSCGIRRVNVVDYIASSR